MMEHPIQSRHGPATRLRNHLSQYRLIAIYLVAIVAANWIVSVKGPSVTVITAFFFIGLNITTRDMLHEMWRNNLKRNMVLLILAGSALSLLFNAGRIAVASFLAFMASESVDALVYHYLWRRGRARWLRVNGSNVISSVVDSFLFPTLAFGMLLPWIIVGQIVAKIGGGAFWWLIFGRRENAGR